MHIKTVLLLPFFLKDPVGRKSVTLFVFQPSTNLNSTETSFFIFLYFPVQCTSAIENIFRYFFTAQQQMADLTLRLSCGKSFDRRKPEWGKNEGMLICEGGKKLNNDCSEA